jgi:hypothetical protein
MRYKGKFRFMLGTPCYSLLQSVRALCKCVANVFPLSHPSPTACLTGGWGTHTVSHGRSELKIRRTVSIVRVLASVLSHPVCMQQGQLTQFDFMDLRGTQFSYPELNVQKVGAVRTERNESRLLACTNATPCYTFSFIRRLSKALHKEELCVKRNSSDTSSF